MDSRNNTLKVWDPLVRIGHWILVVAFFTAYFTEDDFLTQHAWAGYVIGTVVCLRILWGLVGSEYARFSNFVRSPAIIFAYLGDLRAGRARRFIGHNPAGASMIVALLIGLTGTVASGHMLYAIEENAGPLAGWVTDTQPPVGAPPNKQARL